MFRARSSRHLTTFVYFDRFEANQKPTTTTTLFPFISGCSASARRGRSDAGWPHKQSPSLRSIQRAWFNYVTRMRPSVMSESAMTWLAASDGWTASQKT